MWAWNCSKHAFLFMHVRRPCRRREISFELYVQEVSFALMKKTRYRSLSSWILASGKCSHSCAKVSSIMSSMEDGEAYGTNRTCLFVLNRSQKASMNSLIWAYCWTHCGTLLAIEHISSTYAVVQIRPIAVLSPNLFRSSDLITWSRIRLGTRQLMCRPCGTPRCAF